MWRGVKGAGSQRWIPWALLALAASDRRGGSGLLGQVGHGDREWPELLSSPCFVAALYPEVTFSCWGRWSEGKFAFPQDAFDDVVKYFGENPKTTPPSVFFPVFVRFVKAYKVTRSRCPPGRPGRVSQAGALQSRPGLSGCLGSCLWPGEAHQAPCVHPASQAQPENTATAAPWGKREAPPPWLPR